MHQDAGAPFLLRSCSILLVVRLPGNSAVRCGVAACPIFDVQVQHITDQQLLSINLLSHPRPNKPSLPPPHLLPGDRPRTNGVGSGTNFGPAMSANDWPQTCTPTRILGRYGRAQARTRWGDEKGDVSLKTPGEQRLLAGRTVGPIMRSPYGRNGYGYPGRR